MLAQAIADEIPSPFSNGKFFSSNNITLRSKRSAWSIQLRPDINLNGLEALRFEAPWKHLEYLERRRHGFEYTKLSPTELGRSPTSTLDAEHYWWCLS